MRHRRGWPFLQGVTILISFGLNSCTLAQDSAPRAQLISRHVIHDQSPLFGGLSGLEITSSGTGFIAITDRGTWVEGRISRSETHQIESVEISKLTPIRVHLGTRAEGQAFGQGAPHDSEGLAIGTDGGIYVSFEGQHRIGRFDDMTAAEQILPVPKAFETLQRNSGLEALAIGHDGLLYTLPERSGRLNRPFPIYRFDGTAWDVAAQLPREGDFLVVGADFGPDGLLYILERNFTGYGFISQVRRIDLKSGDVDTVLNTHGQFGNLEGLSVWVNPEGNTILTMISDDNFEFFLATALVEYRLH